MNRFYLLVIISALLFSTVYAQNNVKKPLKECNSLLAQQLVEQQAQESKAVEDTDKRINILLLVADFLWNTDEDSARGYLAEAFQIAQNRYHEKGFETKDNEHGLVIKQPDYRFKVISAIAKHDGEWSKKLSETVLKEFDEDKEKENRSDFDKEREIGELLNIAAGTAKNNPALALTLARRAMRYPLGINWYFTLFQMAAVNQTLTNQIYSELLVNYIDTEVFRLLYLSAYPFGRDRVFGVEKYSFGTDVPANFSTTPSIKRQFLIALFRRAMQLTPESTVKSLQTDTPESAVALMAINELEPIIFEQFPDLSQSYSAAKLHLASIVAGTDWESAKKLDERGKDYNRSFEDRLEDAKKNEEESKLTDWQIFFLLNAAKTEEDYAQAESWLDKIKDDSTREGTANYFYFQRSKLATRDKRFDDARKYALKVGKIENRSVLFFDIAEMKMKDTTTKSESLDDLLEILQMTLKSPDSVEKAQVLLGLAFMYEKIDHQNALDSLDYAIKAANKLENPNLFTDRVMQQIIGRDFAFYTAYSVPGFEISRTFELLSRMDFQSALTRTTEFSDKYLRTLATLATVRNCEAIIKSVKGKPKPKMK